MAAPMKNNAGDPNMSVGELSDTSEEVDITSPLFNPISALYAEQVPLPSHIAKDVQLFNNVAEFENAYRKNPGQVVNRHKPNPKPTKSDVTKDPVTKNKNLPDNTDSDIDKQAKKIFEQRQMKRNRTVLSRMERYEKGPYNFLLRCVKEQHHVAVWTRGAVDVRGVCKGFIIAFDKHFNLAMMDIDETYRPPVLQPKTRKKEKQKHDTVEEKDRIQIGETCSIEGRIGAKDMLQSERSPDRNDENKGTINKKSSPDVKTKVTYTDKVEDNIVEMTKHLELRETSEGYKQTKTTNVQVKTHDKGDNKYSHLIETARSQVNTGDKGDNKKSHMAETAKSQVNTGDKGDNKKSHMAETAKSQVNTGDKGDNKKSHMAETAKSQANTGDKGDNKSSHMTETAKSQVITGYKDYVKSCDLETDKSDKINDKISQKETFREDLSERDRLVIGFNEFMGTKNSEVKLLQRHVNQMFIRGDNVVSIAILT